MSKQQYSREEVSTAFNSMIMRISEVRAKSQDEFEHFLSLNQPVSASFAAGELAGLGISLSIAQAGKTMFLGIGNGEQVDNSPGS